MLNDLAKNPSLSCKEGSLPSCLVILNRVETIDLRNTYWTEDAARFLPGLYSCISCIVQLLGKATLMAGKGSYGHPPGVASTLYQKVYCTARRVKCGGTKEKKANMRPGRVNSGGSWPSAFPRSCSIVM